MLFVFLLFQFGWITVESTVCQNVAADVILMLDSSGSIGRSRFDHEIKDFENSLLSGLDIGPSKTQLGVIDFSGSRYHCRINLNYSSSRSGIQNALNNYFDFHGGDTNTQESFQYIHNEMFQGKNGDRSNVQNVIIYVSDGELEHSQAAMTQVNRLKHDGTRIYSVGVHNNRYNAKNLNAISSPGTRLYAVSGGSGTRVAKQLLDQICRDISILSPTTVQPPSTTTARPITTHVPTPPMIIPLSVKCYDRDALCSTYTKLACMSYQTYTRMNCAKYCGFCKEPTTTTRKPTTTVKPTTTTSNPTTQRATTKQSPVGMMGACVDSDPNCPAYGKAICTQYVSWAMGTCPKYCGFCQATPSTQTTKLPQTTKPAQTTTLAPTTKSAQTTKSFHWATVPGATSGPTTKKYHWAPVPGK